MRCKSCRVKIPFVPIYIISPNGTRVGPYCERCAEHARRELSRPQASAAVEHKFKVDIWRDRCCGDCAHYGAEVDGECEIFNKAVSYLPQGFGQMEIPATTSKCNEFKPSRELLEDFADQTAYEREQSRREQAWAMGEHA